MSKFSGRDAQAQTLAKIAHLTALFERLVGEAGVRRERLEQLLGELAEERAAASINPVAEVQPAKRAA